MKRAFAFVAVFFVVVFLKYTDAKCRAVPGYIYIMQEKTATGGSGLLYKVGGVEGASGKVDTRRGNLQTGNPRKLEVKERYQVGNCKKAESAAHGAVNNDYGVYYGGGREWCKVTSDNYDDFKDKVNNAANEYPPVMAQFKGHVDREKDIIQKFISRLLSLKD